MPTEIELSGSDDLTDEPVPYWPAYYPGPGGEA
jgi:hypothetical protein